MGVLTDRDTVGRRSVDMRFRCPIIERKLRSERRNQTISQGRPAANGAEE
jgi:hypothetical protein